MEFTLLGAAAIAMGALYLAIRRDAARANAADCAREHWERALSAAVVGLFTGRVVAMAISGANPVSGDLFIVRAGVNPVAATVAAMATVAWMGRSKIAVALDGLAAAAVIGLGGWHAGCLVRDSCLGTVTDVPWAIGQSASSPGRHPVEIYAAVALIVAGLLLSRLRFTHRLPAFAATGLALGTAGAIRLATEPMRLSLTGGPVAWYAAAAVVGYLGAVASRWVTGASVEATG